MLVAYRVILGIQCLSNGIGGQIFVMAIWEMDFIDLSVHGRLLMYSAHQHTLRITFPT